METLEEMYKGKFSEYENVCAARGCNQHKHVPGCDEAGGRVETKSTEDNASYEKKYDFLRNAKCKLIGGSGEITDNYEMDRDLADAIASGDVQGTWHSTKNLTYFTFDETGDSLLFSKKDTETARDLFVKKQSAPNTRQENTNDLQDVNDALKNKGSRALYDKDLLKQLKQMTSVRFVK